MSDMLEFLAGKAADDPFFLGALLAEFARSERLDDPRLAAHLGCPAEVLARLRLCRAPRTEHPGFEEDLARIATHFGLNVDRLSEVALRGLVLQRFRLAKAAERGLLAAARDGDSPEEEPPPPAASSTGDS